MSTPVSGICSVQPCVSTLILSSLYCTLCHHCAGYVHHQCLIVYCLLILLVCVPPGAYLVFPWYLPGTSLCSPGTGLCSPDTCLVLVYVPLVLAWYWSVFPWYLPGCSPGICLVLYWPAWVTTDYRHILLWVQGIPLWIQTQVGDTCTL